MLKNGSLNRSHPQPQEEKPPGVNRRAFDFVSNQTMR
jgi:hypothetical protein